MRPVHVEYSRATSATIMGPNGPISYQVQMDPLTDAASTHGRSMTVVAIVSWPESNDFVQAVLGYTEYSSGTILERYLPLECVWWDGLYCDEAVLIGSGIDSRQSTYAAPSGWPTKSWCQYRLRFSRPPYNVLDPVSHEKHRYVSMAREYSPRERRISGFGFVYYDPDSATWKQVPDEQVFIPEHTIRYLFTWHQVPENAVPWQTIAAFIGYCNRDPWSILGVTFGAETALFRGPSDTLRRYMGPDGGWYYDIQYVIEHRPGGWNHYTLPQIDPSGARRYAPWRRGVPGAPPGPGLPLPYPPANFDHLFRPDDPVFA